MAFKDCKAGSQLVGCFEFEMPVVEVEKSKSGDSGDGRGDGRSVR